MSFKRKNTKPIRVPETVPCESQDALSSPLDDADGYLCNGITNASGKKQTYNFVFSIKMLSVNIICLLITD